MSLGTQLGLLLLKKQQPLWTLTLFQNTNLQKAAQIDTNPHKLVKLAKKSKDHKYELYKQCFCSPRQKEDKDEISNFFPVSNLSFSKYQLAWDCLFSTYAKFSNKLTFHSPWYAHTYVRNVRFFATFFAHAKWVAPMWNKEQICPTILRLVLNMFSRKF